MAADLTAAIRAYAMRDTRDLQRDPNSMVCLEHCLVESFLMPQDWDGHALWSVEWRTFALIVAEALATEHSRAERYKHALAWALGSNGEFRARELGEGAFWWRKELQARAGLEWDGRKFIDGDARWLMRPHGVKEDRNG